MRVVWDRDRVTAEEVRQAVDAASGRVPIRQPMKDSTVRTILRRLEQKGYATHAVVGRTFVYSPKVESRSVAADAVRGIIQRLCQGSVENLLVGMVDDEIVSPKKLRELADRIGRADAEAKRKRNSKGR